MTLFEEDRLKSSIDCRQNLLNYFEVFLNHAYKPRRAVVDLENKKTVENYFALTGLRLDGIRNYFRTSGTEWQKSRLRG
jgi:hypothetical protein